MRNQVQNKQLHLLVKELNITPDNKEELVYSFSNGRETSSANLTHAECQGLINHLRAMKSGQRQEDKADKMRKKVLSICHEMNWKLPNGKLDWNRINAFLYKYGYLKKTLNDYTEKELPMLITQFENLLKQYYAKR